MSGGARAGVADTTCFHCGEGLPASPSMRLLEGTQRRFCCDGCAAAAQWIEDADLEAYYRLRERPGTRIDEDDSALALWDREEVQAEHARAIDDGGREITLLTDGMRCAACAWLIDRALSREPGVTEVSANAVTGRIRIAWDPALTPLSRPLRRLQSLGYRPFLAAGAVQERARRRDRNRWLLRIGIAALGSMQAMMFAEALYLDTAQQMSLPMRDFLRWIAFLVSTPVVFYAGWPFIDGAARELRHRAPGMDTLIAGSTLLAWAGSVAETVRGGPQVWYDAAVMFVFLLLVARLLEQRVRATASAQVDALARARPAFASRETADGQREAVAVGALRAGDIVRVAPGEPVPADALLLDADASFAEALLTGEARPVPKQPGDAVFAGSLCGAQAARLRLVAVGTQTRLSQLAALIEQAQAHRPPLAQAADRIARWFVLALALATIAVYIAWRLHDPARAFEVALALLVVCCPCALSLAVPAALAASNGALAGLGVLPLRTDALARLARIDTVVFDKTGTLSLPGGQLRVESFGEMDDTEALRIAAALERDSAHPLAAAFHAALTVADATATGVIEHPGAGIEGVVDGRRWRIGRAGFAAAQADDGSIWLGDGDIASARFSFDESARTDAVPTLDALRRLGIASELASGDGDAAVMRFASAVGIASAQARMSPEEKLARVRDLQAQGRAVAMVGDGINDGPVLAGADVSFALGDGNALAARAADLVLAAPDLLRVPQAIVLARRTRAVIRQNLAWALAYNLLALPAAALGMVSPWQAALGMALSSLLVTANALRLARVPAP
ncbi:cadmium-translocating P-type ATPase [Thermomonas carbonis]|uniref:Cadmium-translocating P-type ATPase n=2 Tax=Thermomonas carbonis TaxID=1463158 RepID=A0A7G9SUC9_9GAMM|nr:cadmium-translocating P-type ATPase [Thermomonas carbonis]